MSLPPSLSTFDLSSRIKGKLAELTPLHLQKHYRREARYLLRVWRLSEDPWWADPQANHFITWAAAKDFSRKFPRHSYEEWAFVLGIPRDHHLLTHGTHPQRVHNQRRVYEANSRIKKFLLIDGLLILALYFVLSR